MYRIGIIVFVLTFLHAANPLPAEPPTGFIEGTLRDAETGEPLVDALVSLYLLPGEPEESEDYQAWSEEGTSVVASTHTDEEGYFSFIAPSNHYQLYYSARFYESASSVVFRLEVGETESFEATAHYGYDEPVRKPNIYLYPEAETDVNVWLSFISPGRMTVSEPEYIEGWDVTVTPEGKITAYEPVYYLDPDTGEHWPVPTRGEPAGEYDYLFYEGDVAGPGQLDYGWVVAQEDVENFFLETLAAYGFAGREIEDFVDFWAPRLTDYPLYAVYPQAGADYDELVSMSVFPAPDSVLRVVFTIRGLWEGAELAPTEPAIAPFERRGFTVVEWGVILKESDARFYLH